MKNFILKTIATLGPVGYLPLAPGTWATLVTLAAIVLLKPATPLYIALTAIVTVIGIISSHEAERLLGRKDPGHVVIDEVAGYLVSMAFLPRTPGYLMASFVLFRFFDITKPPPLRKLQDLPGGWGIMVDDILAGVYTNLILQLWKLLAQR